MRPMDQVIVMMKHGSHLYGTATPTSDIDYKVVALPTWRNLLLGHTNGVDLSASDLKTPDGPPTPKNYEQGVKNKAGDIDCEVYSLHTFLKHAISGQTVALDMLHGPRLDDAHPIWKSLVANRSKFYTKSMKAFVGYARGQAAKYGTKGTRREALQRVVEAIAAELGAWSQGWDPTIGDLMNKTQKGLPTGAHIHFHPEDKQHDRVALYEVCGIKMLVTAKAEHYLPVLKKRIDEYGDRAIAAQSSSGADWKALHHAMRVTDQLFEIYAYGDFSYPLKNTPYLMQIKRGEVPLLEVMHTLDVRLGDVEKLAVESSYPEKVSTLFWDEWLIDVMDRYVLSYGQIHKTMYPRGGNFQL